MKVPTLQQNCNNRRTKSFRSNQQALELTIDGLFKSPGNLFWLVLHVFCCIISLILGFRFSRLIFYLLFSTNPNTFTTNLILQTSISNTDTNPLSFPPHLQNPSSLFSDKQSLLKKKNSSRIVVGRHGIRIRPWPHPSPEEVMKAQRLIERVQREQRLMRGIKSSRTIIAITPTYVRTFQTLHLNGLMHTLMLVPFDLVWIVVEAGRVTNETASILSKSGLRVIHVGFNGNMPIKWSARHKIEVRMRLQGLRVVREQRLDGVVMFADDSNMHNSELFDEIQSVQWMGSVSVGILVHPGHSDVSAQEQGFLVSDEKDNLPVPVQGPACNSSGQLVGWHTFNSLIYAANNATYIDDGATVLPMNLEWAGFVLNSKLVWKDAEDKPEWVHDFGGLLESGKDVDSPLALLKNSSFVEPLGQCGRKVLLWWVRVEARADSKFPRGRIIDPPLEIVVPAKHTPWPDAPPELGSVERETRSDKHMEKSPQKTGGSRSRDGSHSKQKHAAQVDAHVSEVSGRHTKER